MILEHRTQTGRKRNLKQTPVVFQFLISLFMKKNLFLTLSFSTLLNELTLLLVLYVYFIEFNIDNIELQQIHRIMGFLDIIQHLFRHSVIFVTVLKKFMLQENVK